MADNTVLPGTGETYASDDIAGVKYFRNKFIHGVDGVNDGDVSNTNPLPVSARRDLLPIRVLSGGLTTSATTYGAGDQVGTQFTLANAARASGGSGTIVGVTLTDVNDIIGAYDVVFYNSSVTAAADNAAFGVSDADALKEIGVVQLAGAFDLGTHRIGQAWNLAVTYDCSGSTSLYALLRCGVAHNFFAAVTDLQLTAWVERN